MNHNLFATKVALVVEAHTAQEPYSLAHALEVASWYIELLRLAGSGSHKDSVVAKFKEFVDSKVVLTHGSIAMEHHAQLLNLLNLSAHYFLRQSIFRNTKHQYSSWFWLHLENLYVESLACQVASNS